MNLSQMLFLILSLKSGQAGRYGDPGDRLAGGTPACASRLPRSEYARKRPLMCAHRSLPCGTPVLLIAPARQVCTASRRCSRVTAQAQVCYVLDRGPFTRLRSGAYRSEFDLSPGAADALGLTLYTGRMQVLYVPLK